MKKRVHAVNLLVTEEQFRDYFSLNSPGAFIVRELEEAGEISGAKEILEAVCLANELYADLFRERMVAELQPSGRAEEFLAKEDQRHTGVGGFIVDIIGAERTKQVMRETLDELRVQANIPKPVQRALRRT